MSIDGNLAMASDNFSKEHLEYLANKAESISPVIGKPIASFGLKIKTPPLGLNRKQRRAWIKENQND